MPFQPMNYSNIEPQGNPFMRDLVDSLTKGYQAGRLPYETGQLEQKQNLDNIRQQLSNVFQGKLNTEQDEKFKSDMATALANRGLAGAQTNQINTMTPLDAIKQKLSNQWYSQLAQSQIDTSQMNTNPEKKVAYMKALIQGLSTIGNPGQNNNSSPSGSSNNLSYTPVGQNAGGPSVSNSPTPQVGGPSNQSNNGSPSLSQMLIKQALGLPMETPQEKSNRELKLFEDKQNIKSSDQPTLAFTTQNQKIIQAIDNTLPLLQKLRDSHVPGQLVSKYYSPNEQKAYKANKDLIVDSLASALKLPSTDKGLETVQSMLTEGDMESDSAYKNRLAGIMEDLADRRQNSLNVVNKSGVKNPASVTGSVRVFYNGKSHLIPTDKLYDALHAGGTLRE